MGFSCTSSGERESAKGACKAWRWRASWRVSSRRRFVSAEIRRTTKISARGTSGGAVQNHHLPQRGWIMRMWIEETANNSSTGYARECDVRETDEACDAEDIDTNQQTVLCRICEHGGVPLRPSLRHDPKIRSRCKYHPLQRVWIIRPCWQGLEDTLSPGTDLVGRSRYHESMLSIRSVGTRSKVDSRERQGWIHQ